MAEKWLSVYFPYRGTKYEFDEPYESLDDPLHHLRVELAHRVDHSCSVNVGSGRDVGVPHQVFLETKGSRRIMLILAQYRWEGPDALTPGKHTIVFDYTYDGPGIAKGGTGVLKVDGKVVATQKQASSIAFLQVADETFDVGVDTRTGVNDKDYQVPFPFNGTINKLTFHLGPPQLAEEDKEKAARAIAIAKD